FLHCPLAVSAMTPLAFGVVDLLPQRQFGFIGLLTRPRRNKDREDEYQHEAAVVYESNHESGSFLVLALILPDWHLRVSTTRAANCATFETHKTTQGGWREASVRD